MAQYYYFSLYRLQVLCCYAFGFILALGLVSVVLELEAQMEKERLGLCVRNTMERDDVILCVLYDSIQWRKLIACVSECHSWW